MRQLLQRLTVSAKRFFVRGRVQGVGFRNFAHCAAAEHSVRGYARNLDDGRVEVYAIGTPDKLSAFAGLLWKGPRFSDVRSVDEQEAAVNDYSTFRIEP
ncbi:MAG: acylphosphatase [Bryobacteraceae bacterium]